MGGQETAVRARTIEIGDCVASTIFMWHRRYEGDVRILESLPLVSQRIFNTQETKDRVAAWLEWYVSRLTGLAVRERGFYSSAESVTDDGVHTIISAAILLVPTDNDRGLVLKLDDELWPKVPWSVADDWTPLYHADYPMTPRSSLRSAAREFGRMSS